MSYLLAISGHPNKFSRPGFLLQALAQHLHPYRAELKAAYAIDLKADSADGQTQLQSLVRLIRDARAIVLLAPIPKDDWSGCLKALLGRLPDRVFQYKPVLVVGSGGFIGEMHDLESSLATDLERLAAHIPLASVHVGIKNWVFVGDRAPSLTTGTEARLANAVRRICAEPAERTGLSEAANLSTLGVSAAVRK
jgi:NAD(P)H-dependent FMN reductase